MINNRQAGRRNRGRNNGRQNGGNRGGDNGNRIDNRARGNAPQLLEKYRNLARDAQLAGDRVNTEYYLQFADHYFRVLADNRARQEEQQARFRRNDDAFDEDGDQEDSTRDYGADAAPRRADGRRDRDGHGDRSRIRVAGAEAGAAPAPASDDEENVGEDMPSRRRPRKVEKIVIAKPAPEETETGDAPALPSEVAAAGEMEEEAPKKRATRGRKPRQPRVADEGADESAPGLDLAALPPAIVRADNDSDAEDGGEEEKPAPRRRGRRPKASAEAAE
ncbi:MAG: DUF4167 domain-containing protein [Sphingobium sp.]